MDSDDFLSRFNGGSKNVFTRWFQNVVFLWLPLFWGSHLIWLVVFHTGWFNYQLVCVCVCVRVSLKSYFFVWAKKYPKIRSLQPKPIIEAKSPRKCVSYLIFPTQIILAVPKRLNQWSLSAGSFFLPTVQPFLPCVSWGTDTVRKRVEEIVRPKPAAMLG